jgi:hypothetical protein
LRSTKRNERHTCLRRRGVKQCVVEQPFFYVVVVVKTIPTSRTVISSTLTKHAVVARLCDIFCIVWFFRDTEIINNHIDWLIVVTACSSPENRNQSPHRSINLQFEQFAFANKNSRRSDLKRSNFSKIVSAIETQRRMYDESHDLRQSANGHQLIYDRQQLRTQRYSSQRTI